MTNNINSKSRGFTIVELLIVIVVIAILAAISIVAYNGIQNRSKTSSAQAAMQTMVKKAEAANAIASSYPQDAAAFAAQSDSSLTGSGITIVAAAITAAPATPGTVQYVPCTGTAGTGAVISYWNYSDNAVVTKSIGQPTATGTCAAGTALPDASY